MSQPDLKAIIREEYIRCAADPAHFMKKYCNIQHPQRGRVLFNLYPFQEKTLRLFRDNPYSIVLKSRQLGISTLAAGYSLWLMLFHKDKNVLCIATKQETAKNMVTKVRFMFDNLPSWLKIPHEENNKLTLRLNNGSQIKATAASSDAGRSEAVSLLIIDEAAFIEQIGEIWASAQQTLACIEENSIITTPNGLYRIKDLISNPNEGFNDLNISVFDRNNNIQQTSHYYKSPASLTYKIKFKDGNHIITTKEHPLLNSNENWIQTQNLKIGDKIKCYYNHNVFGKQINYSEFKYNSHNSKPWCLNNKDMAYLIGLWVAEGSYRKNGISIANGDKEITDWLKDIGFTYSGRVNYSLNRTYVYNMFKNFMNLPSGASNKKVPSKILSSSKEEQIAFLQGCFDGDGSSHSKGISYCSISEQLVQDIHIMLLNFGIKSNIKEVFWKKNKLISNNSSGYRLDINKENSIKFYNIIGFRLKRKQNNINKIESIKNWGGVDLNIDKELIIKLIKNSNYSISRWNKEHTNIEGFLWRKNKNLSKQAVEDLLNRTNPQLPEYKILLDSYNSLEKIYYNEIISIEEYENIITYDLKVPVNTSFLANNIVNHNTGGGAIVLSTPYGTGNWFHQTWVKAENSENDFLPIKLPWYVHPERDEAWRKRQDELLGDPRLAAQECFSGDTIIYTKLGPKYIKDINIGDYVLSHDGTYNKVVRLYNHTEFNPVKIKGGLNNIQKFTTNNHPFLNENNEWEEVKSIINTKNKVKYFPDIDQYNNDIQIDLSKYITSNSPSYFPLKIDNNFIWLTKTSKINRFIDIDYDLGFLIGCFLSEGSLAKNKVEFSFNGKTERSGFPLELERILYEKFNINRFSYYTSKRWEGSSKLYIKDQLFHNFIKICIQGGEKSYNKHISEFLYSVSNKETLKGILDGIMVGDGMLKSEYNISLLLTSEKLIYDVLYISNLLGIHNISIKKGKSQNPNNKNKDLWRDNYTLTWTNSLIESNEKIFSKRIKNWERINTIGKSNSNSNFTYNESPYVSLKIEQHDKPIEVFNIEVEKTHTYVTEYGIVHNCDCDFNTSGDIVFYSEWLDFIRETTIQDPIVRRGADQNLWVWEPADYTREYMVIADVARGDGKDSSACHIIDIATNTQVAEYKGQLPPKEYGYFLVGLASEYNNALLVIENASIGWATLDAVIERGYRNLYYSPKSDQLTAESYLNIYEGNSNLTPGFTMSLKTRPLVINKFREYIGDRSVTIRSKRLLEEMKVFIWKNGRPEAQSGYNDDLVMSFSIGMYLRDTSLKFQQQSHDMTRATLGNITKATYIGAYNNSNTQNPYIIKTDKGMENISWLL